MWEWGVGGVQHWEVSSIAFLEHQLGRKLQSQKAWLSSAWFFFIKYAPLHPHPRCRHPHISSFLLFQTRGFCLNISETDY